MNESTAHLSRRYSLAAALICIASATLLGTFLHWQRDPMSLQDKRFTSYSSIIVPTSLSELPPLPRNGKWDFVNGLNVQTLDVTNSGHAVLRLLAIPGQLRHGLGVRVDGIKSGGDYRVELWAKGSLDANLLLDIRGSDSSNELTVAFASKTGTIIRWSGQIIDKGSKTDSEDWRGFWADFNASDDTLYISLFLLQTGSDTQLFRGWGQQLVIGGIDVGEINHSK